MLSSAKSRVLPLVVSGMKKSVHASVYRGVQLEKPQIATISSSPERIVCNCKRPDTCDDDEPSRWAGASQAAPSRSSSSSTDSKQGSRKGLATSGKTADDCRPSTFLLDLAQQEETEKKGPAKTVEYHDLERLAMRRYL